MYDLGFQNLLRFSRKKKLREHHVREWLNQLFDQVDLDDITDQQDTIRVTRDENLIFIQLPFRGSSGVIHFTKMLGPANVDWNGAVPLKKNLCDATQTELKGD